MKVTWNNEKAPGASTGSNGADCVSDSAEKTPVVSFTALSDENANTRSKSDMTDERPSRKSNASQNQGHSLGVQAIASRRHPWRQRCKVIENNRFFSTALGACLFIALFGNSLVAICDLPDDATSAIDVLMITVTTLFITEIFVTSCAQPKTYPWSFFFWADLAGTLSMAFEISFLLGNLITELDTSSMGAGADAVFLRSVRAAKVGARAGRLVKLIKCADMLLRTRRRTLSTDRHKDQVKARHLASYLMLTLSTRVSLLTVILVLLVPLLDVGQYPEEDLSMQSWALRLEADYTRIYNDLVQADPTGNGYSDDFRETCESFVRFYSGKAYFPYRLEGFPEEIYDSHGSLKARIPGAHVVNNNSPKRSSSIVKLEVDACRFSRAGCGGARGEKATIFFNFQEPKKAQGVREIATILFVVVVMAVSAFDMNRQISKAVVVPMERILNRVRTMAYEVQQKVNEMAEVRRTSKEEDSENSEDGEDGNGDDELDFLENVVKKLAQITALFTRRNVVDATEMEQMDDASKGYILEVMQVGAKQEYDQKSEKESRPSPLRPNKPEDRPAVTGVLPQEMPQSARVPPMVAVASNLPCSRAELDSWDLDLLAMSSEHRQAVIEFLFFDSETGRSTGRTWSDVDTFRDFNATMDKGYVNVPYHNYAHAADVVHTTIKLLSEAVGGPSGPGWEPWLSSAETYALMVAGLGHDVGHPGFTNPFLTETRHELAMKFNDRSPLENMHCSTLFEICSNKEADMFKWFDSAGYKVARKVIVQTILHTDMAHHFDMVKSISTAYELASSICDAQAQHGPGQGPMPKYRTDVLRKDHMLWLQMFLHLADVSNPLKAFKVCKSWAWRVLDEFFNQGDEEKKLGLPVGMLNDRDKVNRPGSQHGFICFLVSPFVIGAVKVFRPLHPLAEQMVGNLQKWKELWVQDARPSDEEVEKRAVDIAKMKETVGELRPEREEGETETGRRDSATQKEGDHHGHLGGVVVEAGVSMQKRFTYQVARRMSLFKGGPVHQSARGSEDSPSSIAVMPSLSETGE